jgi:hypothetical protein
MDAALGGGAMDAQTDAPPGAGADTGVDDDGGAPPERGLCDSERPGCVPAKFNVYANNVLYGGDGEVEFQIGGATFELPFRAGQLPEVLLPVAQPIWVHARIPGCWVDQSMLAIAEDATRLDGALFAFSDEVLAAFTNPYGLTLDDGKAFVMVDFFANFPGAGVNLGVASAPPVVLGENGNTQSPTLLTHPFGNLMLIPNVALGPLVPVPVSPPGYDCRMAVDGLEYEAKPRTVLRMWVVCPPAAP